MVILITTSDGKPHLSNWGNPVRTQPYTPEPLAMWDAIEFFTTELDRRTGLKDLLTAQNRRNVD